MKLNPLFDRVVLIPKKEQHDTLYLPTDDKDQPTVAVVIACADNSSSQPIQVKIGDEVLFDPYACHYFTLEDQTYILIKQIDILAVVEKGDNHE